MPVGLPPHAVGRPTAGLVALDDLADPLRLSLVGGVDDDPVPDMSFHGGLGGTAGTLVAELALVAVAAVAEARGLAVAALFPPLDVVRARVVDVRELSLVSCPARPAGTSGTATGNCR